MPRVTKLIPKFIRKGIRATVRDALFFVVLPITYRLGSVKSIDARYALFVEETKAQASDNFLLVMRELDSRGFTCEFQSLGHYRVGTLPYYGRCVKMVWKASSSRLVFLSDASAPISCLPLRKGTDVVQLWHACGAFKKFGMSTADKLFGDSRAEKKRHPYYENLSLVTVSSPEVRWAYIEAMDLGERPDTVQATGVSRTDVYFDEEYLSQQCELVAATIPQVKGKKIILYAPTFRGRIADAVGPDALDIELMRRRLSDEYVLLVKHHPFVTQRPPIPDACQDFAFDVSESLEIEAAMMAADVCITDYSSLVFEYSLLDRPMAFFAFDRADYDDWRGFYYDYDEMTPGPVFDNTEELVKWICALPSGFDRASVGAFRDRFMSACDGRSTPRIINTVLHEGDFS